MGAYTIQPGDHLAQLADQAGFLSADTVWNAAENADLRAKRTNPSVLAPGDVLFIPDKQARAETRPVDATHEFVAKVDKLTLRLVLYDFDNKPLAGASATLVVEGVKHQLVTGGDGALTARVPRRARSGRLSVPDIELEVDLAIGELDPTDLDSGWQARLVNLGYYRAAETDDEAVQARFWSWALEEFQCDRGLPVTGEADGATRAALQDMHES